MEMSIDKSKQSLSYYQKLFNNLNGDYKLSQVQASELSHSIGTALDIMRRYQMMELDRKSEMVGMLEEIQSEIQKFSGCSCSCSDGIIDDIDDIIQQKIDDLKGEQE